MNLDSPDRIEEKNILLSTRPNWRIQVVANEKQNNGEKRRPAKVIMKQGNKSSDDECALGCETADDMPQIAAGPAIMTSSISNNQNTTSQAPTISDGYAKLLKNLSAAVEVGSRQGGNDAPREDDSRAPQRPVSQRQVTSPVNLNGVSATGPAHVGFYYEGKASRLCNFENDMRIANVSLSGAGDQTIGFFGNLSGDPDSTALDQPIRLGNLAGYLENITIEGKGEDATETKHCIGVYIKWD
ncbi:hypothetical protein NQ176_g5516 [Zarea fungicola]|uniref:Uncharacterized protein n=1 Tax=Zarea fungicola TaxID=93591 RepID=A0ACC1N820_9HYPO|nr:hypothetical protein NQ176_g5516 [Lecanicillium fungicola]